MTEVMTSVTGVFSRIGNKFLEKLQEYTLDRLVWCLVAIGFCWCEVQNYHEYIFWQQMWIMSGVGAFYCFKLGCFSREKRIFSGIVTAIGVLFTIYAVKTNLYYGYHYNNLPIGVLATVTLNLYVLVIYDCIKERRVPFSLNPSMVLILMVVAQQFSVYDYRRYYLYILLTLLPYIMMKKGVRTRSCVLNGIMDGMCIGFFLVQGYAWMHRPYNYSAIRYTGISNSRTTMARIYLAYYAVWIVRYVQASHKKLNIWNGVCRVFSWFMAAFILALVYLTGSRSTVLAIMLMTAIAIAVRYYRPKDKWYKRLGKFGLWGVNCVCVGLISLALFPTAYASVRYLPAYFDEPDYVDSIGYRLLSRPIQEWGESFGWNFEYENENIMLVDDIDSLKYPTFEEVVCENLGRIIPGANEFLVKELGEEVLEYGLNRAEFFRNNGYWEEKEYQWQCWYLNIYYGKDVKNNSDLNAAENEEQAGRDLESMYNRFVKKVLLNLVLRLDAQGIGNKATIESLFGGSGDSQENPWYSKEEYPGNTIVLRLAIHEYSISKLNFEGHSEGSFQMWANPEGLVPHAHNIFLIVGYNFGIPSMILMFLIFIIIFLSGIYNFIRFGKVEYLLSVLLTSGMKVFGWFESGFHYKSEMFVWIILCVIFTDVLHMKMKEVE